jgi:hypothetical protein
MNFDAIAEWIVHEKTLPWRWAAIVGRHAGRV